MRGSGWIRQGSRMSGPEVEAGIDVQDLSGDGGGGGEEDGGACDVVRGRMDAEGEGAGELVKVLRGEDVAGSDAVESDAAFRQVGGRIADGRGEFAFAEGVSGERDVSGRGKGDTGIKEEDDAGGNSVPGELEEEVHGSVEIDPVLAVEIPCRGGIGDEEGCVVNPDVDATGASHGIPIELFTGGERGEVGTKEASCAGTEVGEQGFGFGAGAVAVDPYVGPCGGQGADDGSPDAAGTAGDEGSPPSQRKGNRLWLTGGGHARCGQGSTGEVSRSRLWR